VEKEKEHLRHWNVIFKSTSRAPGSNFDYGGDVGQVGLVKRGRVKDASLAFIQSLVDTGDHRLDMNGHGLSGKDQYRAEGEPPLIVIYAIDKNSETTARSRREPLNASSHLISFSLALPRSSSFVEYVAPIVTELDTYVPDLEDHHHE
jgi:hypothetical protein